MRRGLAALIVALSGPACAQEALLAVPLSEMMAPVVDEILPMERCAGLLLSLVDPSLSDTETARRLLAAERMVATAERLTQETRPGRAPGAPRRSVERYARAYRERDEAGQPFPPGDRAICEDLVREP